MDCGKRRGEVETRGEIVSAGEMEREMEGAMQARPRHGAEQRSSRKRGGGADAQKMGS
jgi:hypothetical protein